MFRPSSKQPEFADLKSILAQSAQTDNALYQVVEQLIDRLAQLQSATITEIRTITPAPPPTGFASKFASYVTINDDSSILPNSRQLSVVQTTTLTGVQNNFALSANCGWLRCNNASLLTLTGFSAGYDGQTLVVSSVGAGQVNLSNNDGGSSGPNRLKNIVTSGITPLAAGKGEATYVYDFAAGMWRLTTHSQGALIDVPFVAGDFAAHTAGTWTVASTDLINFQYQILGSTLLVALYINTSTVAQSGAFPTILKVKIPNAYVPTRVIQSSAISYDNGIAANTYNRVFVIDSTNIEIGKDTTAQWANSTDNTFIRANILFPIL